MENFVFIVSGGQWRYIDHQFAATAIINSCIVISISHSVVSNSLQLHGLTACHAPLPKDFYRLRILEWIANSFSKGSSWPRDWTRVSALQADCLPLEPPVPAISPTVAFHTISAGINMRKKANNILVLWRKHFNSMDTLSLKGPGELSFENHCSRLWQPTPVFLPGQSQRRGSLVGCRLWGRTESDTTEAT